MAKIEPILTLASMFDDPSSGSKEITYYPWFYNSTSTAVSTSSEAIIPTLPQLLRTFMKTSFDITSNYFWTSPVAFYDPPAEP